MMDTLSKMVLTDPRIAKHFCESVLGFEIDIESISPSPNFVKFQREKLVEIIGEDYANQIQKEAENKVAKTEVDILAKLKDGTRIIVEIQREYQDYFVERSMYYSDKNFVDQFPNILSENSTHTAYRYLMPVYSISLLEKSIFPDVKSLKLDFEIVDRKHDKVLLNQGGVPLKRYIFIQLDQYHPNLEENQFKYWSQYWRNEEISPNADSEIFSADNIINEDSWNEEVQTMVDLEIKLIEDEKARLDTAENRGRILEILDLVKENILTVAQASKRLGKTEAEILSLLN